MKLEKDMEKKRYRIIGTAGHIDHGKTCLVKALTGKDTDRLAEEKSGELQLKMGSLFWTSQMVPGLGLLMCPGMKGL